MELWNIESFATEDHTASAAIGPEARMRLAVMLQRHLPPSGRLLHLEAGPGAAAAVLARRFRGWHWQPVVSEAQMLDAVEVWRGRAEAANLSPPLLSAPSVGETLAAHRFDAVLVGAADSPRLRAALRLADQVLASGGICVVLHDVRLSSTDLTWEPTWEPVDLDDAQCPLRICVLERRGI